MLKTRNIVIASASLLLLTSWVVRPLSMAADEPLGDRPGDRPLLAEPNDIRPGRMDPQAMHKMMLGRMKNELAATDQEWVAIEPLLEKVMRLSNEINPRGMAMMGGRSERFAGQPGRRVDQAEQSELQKASVALREVIQKADSTPDEVNGSLAAFRTAKEIAQKELAAEQDKLKEVVNARQEAKLVLMGMLN